MFTGTGIVGALVSNGFNPRNRLNTGVSLKSLLGTKNLLDAILETGGGARTHARGGVVRVIWSATAAFWTLEWWPFKNSMVTRPAMRMPRREAIRR